MSTSPIANRYPSNRYLHRLCVSGPPSVQAVLAGLGPDMHPLTVSSEQAQDLGGFVAGAAEPVRYLRVKLGDLAGRTSATPSVTSAAGRPPEPTRIHSPPTRTHHQGAAPMSNWASPRIVEDFS